MQALVALPYKYHPINSTAFSTWLSDNNIPYKFTGWSAHERETWEGPDLFVWHVNHQGCSWRIWPDDGDSFVWEIEGDDAVFTYIKLVWGDDMLKDWELCYGDWLRCHADDKATMRHI